jgi:hypothetical protein
MTTERADRSMILRPRELLSVTVVTVLHAGQILKTPLLPRILAGLSTIANGRQAKIFHRDNGALKFIYSGWIASRNDHSWQGIQRRIETMLPGRQS